MSLAKLGRFNIQPLRDRVVIKKHKAAIASPGGIIIPDVCQDKPVTGEILAIGPGVCNSEGYILPIECKVGDSAVFSKYSGTNYTVDGEEFFVIAQSALLLTYCEDSQC